MTIMYSIIVGVSIVLAVLKGVAIYKATQKEYSSIYITMFRGFNVSSLLKEKEIKTDKVKKAIIINSILDLVYIFAVLIYFFVTISLRSDGLFYSNNILSLIFPLLIFKFVNDFITDWQINKAVRESSPN